MDLRLRSLGFGARLGVTGMLLTLAGGFAASGAHLVEHHENRDEREGLSMEDLLGAYHGVQTTAPMRLALERGHPEDLPQAQRDLLLKWLESDRINEDYDNLDLGDASPAEIMDGACLSCHARNATEGDGIGQTMPLEYWDDVEAVSFSRDVSPTSIEILIASTHTHAIALANLSLVLALLLALTRFGPFVKSGLTGVMGLSLLLDLAGWWLVRDMPGLLVVMVGAGVVYAASSGIAIAVLLADLWLPSRGD